MYLLYTCLSLVAVRRLLSPYFVYQALRYRKYVTNLRQRLGYLPVSFNVDGDESIWIHAVSVGEALTARAARRRAEGALPAACASSSRRRPIAGQQVAAREIKDADATFYFPLDLGFIVRRTLRLVKPRLFVVMETEIWPNLLRECRARGRADGARQRPDLEPLVPALPPGPAAHSGACSADVDRFCMQSSESARRLIDLGADPARVDRHRQPEVRLARGGRRRPRTAACRAFSRYFRVPEDRPVIVAGSTMKGRGADGAAGVRAHRAPARRARCSSSRRATPSGSTRSSGSRARRGSGRRAARSLTIDEEPARRRRRARHDRRAGAPLPGGDGRLRRRQPGADRRPQHPRAGRVRQADPVRPAHAELPRDCRDVPRARAPPCRCATSGELEDGAARPAGRRGAAGRRSAAAAQAIVEANHGARERTLAAIADAAAARRAAAEGARRSGW